MTGTPPHGTGRLRPGLVLGDFALTERLGAGAQGEVWEARQRSLGRVVALKVLGLPGFGTALDERGQREATAMSRVSHPGLAALHGIEHVDGYTFLVMERVHGEPLASRIQAWRDIRARPRDEPFQRVATRLALRIAEALATAHEGGVVHRDVKPSNVLLGPDDSVKVIDFGLASHEGSTSLTKSTDMLGTPFYMSPEQIRTHNRELDARTDVFGLGVTLYEMLTGERPFLGDTIPAVLHQVLSFDPVPPHRRVGHVDRDLSTVCMKAIEKSRVERYPSMRAFADDLRRFLADEPVLARPPGPLRRLDKWRRRHPALATSAAMGALLLVTVTVAMTLLWRQLQETDAAVDLLLGAIRTTDPHASTGVERTVAEAIEDMIAAGPAFERAPAWMRVKVLAAAAGAWTGRGSPEEASHHVERIDAIAREEGWEPDDRRLFEARLARAWVASSRGAWGENEERLASLLRDATGVLPETDRLWVDIHSLLGIALQNVGRLDEAAVHAGRALELHERRPLVTTRRADGHEHEVVNTLAASERVQLMINLAVVNDHLDTPDAVARADALWDRSLRLAVEHLGPYHPTTLSHVTSVAVRDRRAGRVEAAESGYQWALLMHEQGGLQAGTRRASTARNYGILLHRRARDLDDLRAELDARAADHPSPEDVPPPRVVDCWDRAFASLREAADLRRAHLGRDSPRLVEALQSVANTALRSGRWAQGLAAVGECEALAARVELPRKRLVTVAYLHGRLAQAYGDLGRARFYATQADALWTPEVGESLRDVIRGLRDELF